MSKRILTAAAPLAAMLAVAGTALGHSAKTPTLSGTVGPGYTISLKMNGKAVKTLTAGTYTFVVSDKASIHGFTIEKEKGGTFEKALTGVSFAGTKTATVKLTRGSWKFYCPPHESMMFGDFKVS